LPKPSESFCITYPATRLYPATHTLPRRGLPSPLLFAQPAVRARESTHPYRSAKGGGNCSERCPTTCSQQVLPRSRSRTWTTDSRRTLSGCEHNQKASAIPTKGRVQVRETRVRQGSGQIPNRLRYEAALPVSRVVLRNKRFVRFCLVRFGVSLPLSTVCALAPFSVLFGLSLVRSSSFG
jgi:hypothetical protein